MWKNFKRCLALLLAVVVVLTGCIYAPDHFLYAADEETECAVDEREPEVEVQELVLEAGTEEETELPQEDTENPETSDEDQKAYFYALKPGSADTDKNYQDIWFYMGTGSVKAPNATASEAIYDDFNMVTEYPESYPELDIGGVHYTYDASGEEAGTYKIRWYRIKDSSGANNGNEVITQEACYHVDGYIEFNQPEEKYEKYHVTYEGNGGLTKLGEETYRDPETYPEGYQPIYASMNQFTRENAVFVGWIIEGDDTKKLIPEDQTFVMQDHDMTLIAQWKMLTVDKTYAAPVGKPNFEAGDTIYFNIVVTNAGDILLTDIVVTDHLAGAVIDEGAGYAIMETEAEGQKYSAAQIDSLAVGDSLVVKAHYTVKEEDIGNDHFTNMASAAAEDLPVVGKETEIIPIESVERQLLVSKEVVNYEEASGTVNTGNAMDKAFAAGDLAKFDIVLTNVGNQALTNITVEEALEGARIVSRGGNLIDGSGTDEMVYTVEDGKAVVASLPVGKSVTVEAEYRVQNEDIIKPDFKNTTVVLIEGEEYKRAEAPIRTVMPDAHMTLLMTTPEADAGRVYGLGEAITYTITVVNDGDIALKDIVVEDELTGNVGNKGAFIIDRLEPGESSDGMVVTYTVADADVKAGKVVNVVTAAGKTDIPGLEPEVKEGRKEVPVSKKGPSLSIIKSADKVADVKAGDVITYTITVYNNGDEMLRDVDIVDELTKDAWRIVELAPGKSWHDSVTYTVTEADILNGSVVNVAAASGIGPDGNEINAKSGIVTTYTEAIRADYTVAKRILNPQSEYIVNDSTAPIRYEITVTSQANVTLHNVVVKDRLEGASGRVTFTEVGKGTLQADNSVAIRELAPGETVTLHCEYTVSRADAGKNIVNTAIAAADPVVPTGSENSIPVMPEEKRSSAVSASAEDIYTLTIHYRYASGREAAPDVTAQYLEGESFFHRSPSISGYRPNYTFIKSGSQGMPARDVTVTVTYRANTSGSSSSGGTTTDPAPAPGPAPSAAPDGTAPAEGGTTTPVPGTTPAAAGETSAADDAVPMGGMVELNEDGSVDIVPVADENVPLSAGAGGFSKNMHWAVHLLLMLASVTVFASYIIRRKKCLARIITLTEQLKDEEDRRM